EVDDAGDDSPRGLRGVAVGRALPYDAAADVAGRELAAGVVARAVHGGAREDAPGDDGAKVVALAGRDRRGEEGVAEVRVVEEGGRRAPEGCGGPAAPSLV